MQLSHINIVGFRGISRLSLDFDQLTTFIGENTWGKSSLLDALSLALSPSGQLYPFVHQDFHVNYNLSTEQPRQEREIQIVLQFKESFSNEAKRNRYRQINALFFTQTESKEPLKVIYYRLSAQLDHKNRVNSEYQFLDNKGDPISKIDHIDKAKFLMDLHPIIRMRDARRLRDESLNQNSNTQSERLKKRLDHTVNRLLTQSGAVDQAELKSSMDAISDIMNHYFAFEPHNRQSNEIERSNHVPSLGRALLDKVTQENQMVYMGLMNSYIRSLGEGVLKASSRPILIFEDPEARLHPIFLKQLLGFLEFMPMQKIITTNSSELLAQVNIHSIRRFIRRDQYTAIYQVKPNSIKQSEQRLINFHIHKTRANVLFARVWLFVEGESDIWIFSEFAKLMGFDLSTEGIELIQFAQSGLKPLIKLAKHLGIEWHMVADSDVAGKKYQTNALSLLESESESERITMLPELDIEHFLYKNGYRELFIDMAKATHSDLTNIKKIIDKAIKRSSKPDVALQIVHYTETQGAQYIPKLFRTLINRLITVAKGQI